MSSLYVDPSIAVSDMKLWFKDTVGEVYVYYGRNRLRLGMMAIFSDPLS